MTMKFRLLAQTDNVVAISLLQHPLTRPENLSRISNAPGIAGVRMYFLSDGLHDLDRILDVHSLLKRDAHRIDAEPS